MPARDALLPATKRRRWTGSRALVVLPPGRCPACGDVAVTESTYQPALIRHGGYGATLVRTLRVCLNKHCRWTCEVQTQESRPDAR